MERKLGAKDANEGLQNCHEEKLFCFFTNSCVIFRKLDVILFHFRVFIKPWCEKLACNRSFNSFETLQGVFLQPSFVLDIYEIK